MSISRPHVPEPARQDGSGIQRLCAAHGIATAYQDIHGVLHTVAEQDLVALLAEFGIGAGSPEAAAPAQVRVPGIAAQQGAMPAVAVVTAGEAAWSVTLARALEHRQTRWTIVEEGGARRQGHATAADGRIGQVEFECALPAGYHRLAIEGVDGETLIIAAPARCYRPPACAGEGRIWGFSVQLYALRSRRNWGIGDFSDLAVLVGDAAIMGADIVGLNPLHALFLSRPDQASPYSPASRLFLNTLYIDVEAVEDFFDCDAARQRARSAQFCDRLEQLRASALVDYRGVAEVKAEVLEILYAHFRRHHLAKNSERARAFREFQADRGPALRLHATWEALQAHFLCADAANWGWPVWPAAYRECASAEVALYAEANLERIEYYEYLQWQAHLQIDRVAERCRRSGMGVGLYLDLAVSVDRAGSDAWGNPDCYAPRASIGAPPDDFNALGQDWGLPPLRPDRLRERAYRPFIAALRANMRIRGCLRIDHVMGLMRLFWVPPGKTARDGAYVHYELEEMLAIVALESDRNRCMVIGEDLGTVADELRAALERRHVLSYRLLYFERRSDGAFRPAAEYPREALSAISTHDLPTLAGWWEGHDLRVRFALRPSSDGTSLEQQLAGRARERRALVRSLDDAGFLPVDAGQGASDDCPLTPAMTSAIHAFVASSPSRVTLVQVDDALGVRDQPNLPGTVHEHPNWRRKLPGFVEDFPANQGLRGLAGTLARIRPRRERRQSPPNEPQAVIPRATYRIQFHKNFTFDDAVERLPYLARLGVSHVYCSPILRARPGSTHGYDIVSHDEINPELGGAEGFERFSNALRDLAMGQLLDMVPNHMGVLGARNDWWADVLENGADSRFASFFDIDWHPVNADLEGKILIPALGEPYGNALASGRILLVYEGRTGTFEIGYHEHRLPLNPRGYAMVVDRAGALATGPQARTTLASLAEEFSQCAWRVVPRTVSGEIPVRAKGALRARLAQLSAGGDAVAHAIHAAVWDFNADGPRDLLHELLEVQAYRLAYWRVAADEINYRRFFDINELAALRMESEAVFEATHAFVLDLAATGKVDGLRIDHPDGLFDPARYFRRLQEGYARRREIPLEIPQSKGRPLRPLYVLIEKIAAPHEDVPGDWHVHGTTGYRFAMVVNGVLVDAGAKAKFERIWRAFSGEARSYPEMAYLGKRAIMRSALASELTVLSSELLRIARADRRTRDFTFNTLREALAEVAACLPVYRTYIVDRPSAQDLRYVDWAVAQARRRARAADVSILDFVRSVLLGQAVEGADASLQSRVKRFATRFQQFTAPVAAKGVEDTAFYRYGRLTSLNEVGGDPDQFGMSVRAFHGAGADRAARWPHTMLATSTHDNKRSEDVRSRIDVLSEIPAGWRLALRRWSALNRAHRTVLDGGSAPSAADEYVLYQTLLGSLPVGDLDETMLAEYRERIGSYMLKAVREAKANTSWISPNPEYESALSRFIGGLLARVHPNPFLADLRLQVRTLAWFGALNSVSMTLMKLTSPGVPDLYQGSELLDLSLVDPDNRRPVDFGHRERLLSEFGRVRAGASYAASLLDEPEDGRAKFWAIWRLLELRRSDPAIFSHGAYKALAVRGERATHAIAYRRSLGGRQLVVVAGRLYAKLLQAQRRMPLGEAVWADTRVEIPGASEGMLFENVLTGERIRLAGGAIRVAEAFTSFPAAALVAAPQDDHVVPTP